MRKHKIKNLKSYANACEEKELTGRDGVKVIVRSHIPYEQKIEFVRSVAEENIMVHEDSCCYKNYAWHPCWIYHIAKYYTDINVDEAEYSEIADFLINDDLLTQVEEAIFYDLIELEELYDGLIDSFKQTFDDDRSLRKAIRSSFGFLFTGEDITESLAKAEAAKDVIYKAVGALREKEKEESENIHSGTINLGGNIIDITKRE